MSQILIVEDDPKIRAGLIFQLEEEGHRATGVGDAESALAKLGNGTSPDLLLLDVRLPGISGVELLRSLSAREALPPTVIVSGEASISEAVEALQLGVHDVIEKPFSRERLVRAVANTLETASLRRSVQDLAARLSEENTILGDSAAIAEVRRLVAMAAPTDARVLILGESGTGKELVADAIHGGSPRAGHPFVKVNCAAIPETLVESELFGHAKGAFTDARQARAGLFEEADGGTLFLDEIGDMPRELQARLLRVLEDGVVRRVGEARDREVDVRVIAATNHDLDEAVRRGDFRQDLFFRLSTLPLPVPPLRQRPEDLRILFPHFIELFRRRHGTARRDIDDSAYPCLERYPWPGNVRELKAVAERLVIFAADPIDAERVGEILGEAPPQEPPDGVLRADALSADLPLRELRAACEREYIEAMLQRKGWNFSAAARDLGIQRTYLHQKAASLGISRPS